MDDRERRMEAQRRVAAFADEQGYDGDQAYRLTEPRRSESSRPRPRSRPGGDDPAALAASEEEVGDALVSLLLFAET